MSNIKSSRRYDAQGLLESQSVYTGSRYDGCSDYCIVNVDYSTQANLKVVSVSRAILSRHADDWYGAFPSSRVGDFVKSTLTENIVSKKFTLEVIVQVARSLGTKPLDANRIFSLRGFVGCIQLTLT